MSGIINTAGAKSGLIGLTQYNTLDFEEGAWAPSLGLGMGSAIMDTGYNAFSYIKMGSMVFCSGRLELTSVSTYSSGTCKMYGLPFTCGPAISGTDTAGNYFSGGLPNCYDFANNAESLAQVVMVGNTYAQWYLNTNTGHDGNAGTALNGTAAVILNLWYRTETRIYANQ